MSRPRVPARPMRDGVAASRLQLPPGPWATLHEALCARFPRVGAETWRTRFERGLVLDAQGRPLEASTPCRTGDEIFYFREVADEAPVAGVETVLHADQHLVVVDKPHFLPVAPTGAWVRETLLTRLVRRFDNPDLVPLHRIDRETAGLVMFSASKESRGRYQALFRERRIRKVYLALAPPLPEMTFPHRHRSRMERGDPFFRMREASGGAQQRDAIGGGRTRGASLEVSPAACHRPQAPAPGAHGDVGGADPQRPLLSRAARARRGGSRTPSAAVRPDAGVR